MIEISYSLKKLRRVISELRAKEKGSIKNFDSYGIPLYGKRVWKMSDEEAIDFLKKEFDS